MNTRKDNNGQALTKWQAMKPGHIARPLRFIRERTYGEASQYFAALAAAKRGDGLSVQKMASAVLAKELT